MKIVIIGGVASGTSVAAKASRGNRDAEIVLFERDKEISYAVCGIPYVIGGEVEDFSSLVPRDAKYFKDTYNVDVFTQHEVTKISYEAKKVFVKNLVTGETFEESFDQLVIATGTVFQTPKVFENCRANNLFRLKNIPSGEVLQKFLQKEQPKDAIIVGSGFISLEICEQLQRLGLKTTMLTNGNQAMPAMDEDMAVHIEEEMKKQNVTFLKNVEVAEVLGDEKITSIVLKDGRKLSADLFIVATGVKANTQLFEECGGVVGKTGAIQVSNTMETNLKDVYAVGDVAEKYSRMTGEPMWIPLATHANKEGRIAGDAMTGGDSRNEGILGTSILRFFDQTIAQTGLTEKGARDLGFDVEVLFNLKPDRPDYISNKSLLIKAIADKKTQKILGAQMIGERGVDKRIDVFATALSFGAKASELFQLDLAYSPIYSTTKDPVNFTGMALTNLLNK